MDEFSGASRKANLKPILTTLLIIVTLAILTSCKTKEGVAGPISPTGNITIYFACPGQDIERFTKLAEAFHDQNPSIHVEVISLEDVRDGTTNQGIDRLVMSRVDTAYYWLTYEGAVDGSFLDLKPFIDADNNFDKDDFFPATLTTFEQQGGIWGLPSEADISFLLYDRDLFDAADVPYPETSWTREDFLSAALRTTTNNESGTQFGYLDDGIAMAAFISFFTDRNSDDTTSLTAPSLVEEVRWYTDMALKHKVMYSPPRTQEGFDQAYELRQGKQIAMWRGSWFEYEYGKNSRNIGLALYPTIEGPQALAHMYGYVISSGSQYPQESWQWLNFLSHQTISDGRFLPSRRSVAEATGYWAQFQSEDVEFLRFAAEHLAAVSPIKPGGQELSTAIFSILSGTPVEEALAVAETNLAERLAILSEQGSFVVDSLDTQRPITVRFAASPDDSAIYQTLAAEFYELQQDIQVDLLPSSQISQSDCFVDQRKINPLEPPDDLLNLESFLAADGDLHLDDFHSALVEDLRSRGELYGLPLQAQARVIFYPARLFEEAGVHPPPADWTLDDFLSLAISLTDGEEPDKQYGFVPLNGDVSDLRVFLSLQGASTTDSANRPSLDSPQLVNALQWYADLALQYGVAPLFAMAGEPDAAETRHTLIGDGKVALWSDFVGLDRSSIWPEETAVGIVPLPVGAIKGTDFLTEGFFITLHTSQAEACWKWMNFLSAQPELINAMPARQSILDTPEFAMQARPGEIAAYQAMQSYGNLLAEPHAMSYFDEMIEALYQVYAGSSPASALQRVQLEVEQ